MTHRERTALIALASLMATLLLLIVLGQSCQRHASSPTIAPLSAEAAAEMLQSTDSTATDSIAALSQPSARKSAKTSSAKKKRKPAETPTPAPDPLGRQNYP